LYVRATTKSEIFFKKIKMCAGKNMKGRGGSKILGGGE
jgi:hypothetical protein